MPPILSPPRKWNPIPLMYMVIMTTRSNPIPPRAVLFPTELHRPASMRNGSAAKPTMNAVCFRENATHVRKGAASNRATTIKTMGSTGILTV